MGGITLASATGPFSVNWEDVALRVAGGTRTSFSSGVYICL